MRHRLIQRRLELDPPLSREALALKIGTHPKHLARIERGEVRQPSPAIRHKLAKALDWSAAELTVALADEAPETPLGTYYRAPTVGLDMLSMLEQSCRQLRTLELSICPGLLQTHPYALAIEGLEPDEPGANEIARRVGERMVRQQRAFEKDDPLRVFALLDRSILRSDIGGPDVMAGLVDHLHDMNDRPHVTVRLLSDAGRIAASNGPFQILTGDDSAPFMVVTEDLSGLNYRGGRSVVDLYHHLWRFIWERGSDPLGQVELQQG